VETWRFQANRNLCALQLSKIESIITVQRDFRTKYHTERPTDKTIREWCRKFEETGCLYAAKKKPGGQGHRLRLWTAYDNPLPGVLKNQHIAQASDNFILQQDGAPPHFHLEVRRHLSTILPQRWIGRTFNENSAVIFWPPRSPDLTPCDIFLWGYVKDKVYVPTLPRHLPELRQRIVAAVDTINVDMLQRVWQELDYRIDICRVTRGGHVEHL
jgi:hypothetical protein